MTAITGRRERWSGVYRERIHQESGDRESGAAIVEFALMSILLVMLLFAVLQVAVYFYIRNVVRADAVSGARFAAPASVDTAQGSSHAVALIDGTLGSSVANALTCTSSTSTDAPSGLGVVVVHCVGTVRSVFLPIGGFLTLNVTASALKEPAP